MWCDSLLATADCGSKMPIKVAMLLTLVFKMNTILGKDVSISLLPYRQCFTILKKVPIMWTVFVCKCHMHHIYH